MPTYNYDSSLLTQYLRDRNLFAWNFYNRNLVQAGQSVRPEQHPPVSEEVTLNRVVGGVVPYRNGQEAFPFDLPPVAEGGVTPTPPPPPPASGGAVQWVTSISGVGNVFINSVVADSAGNIYVAGLYSGSTPGDVATVNSQAGVTSGTINTTAAGNLPRNTFWPQEAFIAKYNATGVAQWFTKIEGDFSQGFISLATDSANNLYMTCYVSHNGSGVVLYNGGAAAIGSVYGTIQTAILPVFSIQSILVKYAGLDGAVQWATTIYVSEFADCTTRSISVGTDDSIYICGDFNGDQSAPYDRFITINNASSPNVSGGDVQVNAFGTLSQADYASNGFVVKYNTSGQAQLATRIEAGISMNTNELYINNIYAYSNTSIYITGRYASNLIVNNYSSVTPGSPPTINISPYGTLNQNDGQYDIFVIKFNTSLAAQWATRVGSVSNDNSPFITVDNLENVIITGDYFNNTLTIYNGASSSGGIITTPTSGFTLPNSGNTDYFIVKYNSSGIAQWATRIAGTSNDSANTSIAHDSDNNIYVCSSYSNDPINIYNADTTSVTLARGTAFANRCLVKYSPLGVVTWATSIGANSAAGSFNRGGLVYSSGYVYLAADNTSFDSPRAPLGFNDYTSTTGGAVTITAYGTLANSSTNPNNSNSFLAKYSTA